MINFIAHAGHDHAEPTPLFVTPEVLISLSVVGIFIAIILLIKYVFKLKPSTRLAIVMGYLFLTGAGLYQFAPVISVIALASGITLALATTLFQLAKK